MIWGPLLNRYTGAGLVILTILAAVFFAGNHYGPNARKYAACRHETERRNTAIAAANRLEEARHAAEEAKRKAARDAFNKQSVGQCLLTGDQAAALNGIGE